MEDHEAYTTNFKEKYFQELPLMESPLPVTLILVFYLVFTIKIGPYYMKNRPAYDLNKFLIIYNAVQVVVSLYIFVLALELLWQHGLFDTACTSQSKKYFKNLLYGGYCYFLAKLSELLDTVFFVLRKKQNQVTFLHVYHHSLMLITVWGYLKYESSHSSAFLGTLNSLVHVVMYTYYGLAAIPAMRKYLWWKKYLTSMQLVQFALVLMHILAYPWISKCPPSIGIFILVAFNLVVFIYLFSKFYINSYIGNNKSKLNLDNLVCSNLDQNNDYVEIDNVELGNDNDMRKVVNGVSKQY